MGEPSQLFWPSRITAGLGSRSSPTLEGIARRHTRFQLPHLRLILLPPSPPALIQGQPLGVPRCLSSAAQLLRQLRDDCVFSGGIFLQTCSISRHFACHLLCHTSGTLLQAGKFQTYDFGKKTNELLEIGKFLGFTGSGRSGCGCSKRVGGWE